jgi:hypothetical protein
MVKISKRVVFFPAERAQEMIGGKSWKYFFEYISLL